MDIDLAGLIYTYGYLAVLVGAFLEGETILALAGLAAYRGHLDLLNVIAIALVAGFAGDQFFFFLGRAQGVRILVRFPHALERAHRFDAMLSRWHAPLIVCIRFMYGFRIIGPVLLGMGRVPAWKFLVYNFLGAAIWAPLIAGLGYLFGGVLEALLHDMTRYEIWGFLAIIVVGVTGVIIQRVREKKVSGTN